MELSIILTRDKYHDTVIRTGACSMILDMTIASVLIGLLLVIIGLCLVLYGKEILLVLSFPIGAFAGGILAYMILEGLLYVYDIPLWIEIIVGLVIVICGGILGTGTMAMLVALFISLVFVDVLTPMFGSEYLIIISIFGVLSFLLMVYFVQKILPVFSSFLGGVFIAMGVSPLFDSLDEPIVRIIQLCIAAVFCVLGSILQYWLYHKLQERREEIVWVPSKA